MILTIITSIFKSQSIFVDFTRMDKEIHIQILILSFFIYIQEIFLRALRALRGL